MIFIFIWNVTFTGTLWKNPLLFTSRKKLFWKQANIKITSPEKQNLLHVYFEDFSSIGKKNPKRFEWNFPFPKFNLQKNLIYSKLSNISKTFSSLLKQDLKNLLFACTNFPTHKMVLRACSCTQIYVFKKTSLWALIYIV